MTVRTHWTKVSSFDALVLENDRIRVVVIPELGGRVWELTDILRGRKWVWHRGIPLVKPTGNPYDDVWAGGWEELFPNDAPGRFEGRVLPDHGEWWATEWQVADMLAGDTGVLLLSAEGRIRRSRWTKRFDLPDDDSTLTVSYRIENLEAEGFHFLFKQHFSVELTPGCRLAIPGGRVDVVDLGFGNVLQGPGPFEWPWASVGSSRVVDLADVPVRGLDREFLYLSRLPEGWCGVDDPAYGATLRMRFDRTLMPFVWLFLTYGGWRDCYTVVLEPCTNMPKELAEAVRLGQSAFLPPLGTFETSVTVALDGFSIACT